MEKELVTKVLLKCPFRMKSSPRGRKWFSINLNQYTNWHFQQKNNLKKYYKELMRSQLEGIEIQTPVQITYKVYKPTKRHLDKMNVVSISSKFLMDAITELGCWPDDNDEHIKHEIILPTELDRDEPRVEVLIKTIK